MTFLANIHRWGADSSVVVASPRIVIGRVERNLNSRDENFFFQLTRPETNSGQLTTLNENVEIFLVSLRLALFTVMSREFSRAICC